MDSFFCLITEENKYRLNKPAASDMIYYSELHEGFVSNAFRSFSIKYIIDNCIHYKIAGREYSVGSGNFLLACRQPHVKAYFESEELVKSICIDIRPETIHEAFTIITAKETCNFENYSAGYFQYPNFFEIVRPIKSAATFNLKLYQLSDAIQNRNVQEVLNREWFLDLAERIIYHEYGNHLSL